MRMRGMSAKAPVICVPAMPCNQTKRDRNSSIRPLYILVVRLAVHVWVACLMLQSLDVDYAKVLRARREMNPSNHLVERRLRHPFNPNVQLIFSCGHIFKLKSTAGIGESIKAR